MASNDNKKALVFSILEFLQKSCNDGTIATDDAEGIEVAMECIGQAFGVDLKDPAQKEAYNTKPANLLSIFDVFLKTKSKKAQTTTAAESSTLETPPPQPVQEVSEENKKKAEELKLDGNRKVQEKDYTEAIKLYTEAIKLDGNNAVFYGNRAAAYSQNKDYQLAVDDATAAALIDPKYSKAYSRLGHALFSLERYQEAIDAYEKGLKIDPTNATLKQSLEAAKAKANSGSLESRETSAGANAGGAPGGMPDLSGLLNNPAMMNMAQQVMQNPEMMNNLMSQMSGSGEGGPFAEMMNNPALMNMARQFMGGNGGQQP